MRRVVLAALISIIPMAVALPASSQPVTSVAASADDDP